MTVLGLSGFGQTVLSILLIILAIIFYSTNRLTQLEPEPKPELLIGIISSRSNFEQRDAIRNTWLTDPVFRNRVKAVFVLGNESCPIPPEDRVNYDSCAFWNVSQTGKQFQTTCRVVSTSQESPQLTPGFNFKVRHPILIDKLGVLESILHNIDNGVVKMINRITEETVVESYLSSSGKGEVSDGYHYYSVDPYIYPKNFEGLIILEVNNSSNVITTKETQLWNSGTDVILISQLDEDEKTINWPYRKILSAVSFKFLVQDSNNLDKHIGLRSSRNNDWGQQLQVEAEKIKKENSKYQDLIIVDVMDTYRNLPIKLLQFFKQISTELDPQFVLKTDDDVVLDISKIIQELNKLKQNFTNEKFWWSRFRYNWAVDRVGKWAEIDYRALVYPPFACGIGNVLSVDLVHWLTNNTHNLYPYQGEDVSLGIWLAAIGPTIINDLRWQCGDSCVKDSFNRGQLTPSEIKSVWASFKECSNLCGCN